MEDKLVDYLGTKATYNFETGETSLLLEDLIPFIESYSTTKSREAVRVFAEKVKEMAFTAIEIKTYKPGEEVIKLQDINDLLAEMEDTHE